MEKFTGNKILLTAIAGSSVLVLILMVLVSLSLNKKKVIVTKPIVNKTQSNTASAFSDKESPVKITPTQNNEMKEIVDYNQIESKVLAYIKSQKNGNFYNLSNNQKDISYHANSYLSSAYFDQDVSQAINLADSLKDHCQEKKDFEKDCYFILEPYFKLYSYNKHPRHLEFIKKNLSQLENYSSDSLNAYVNLSKQYLSYYLINFDNVNYQKALSFYQKALDLLPKNKNDIGLLIQNQQIFYQITNNDVWLKTGNNYFDQFDDSQYQKMNATQKLSVLIALQDFPLYKDLYNRLLSEFIIANYNKDSGFICSLSNDCGINGLSLIIDNALFIKLLNK